MNIRKLSAIAFALMVPLAACDVDQTEDGELPEVSVEGGEMPEYDVDAADVDVHADTTTVVVPDVDVNPPHEGGEGEDGEGNR